MQASSLKQVSVFATCPLSHLLKITPYSQFSPSSPPPFSLHPFLFLTNIFSKMAEHRHGDQLAQRPTDAFRSILPEKGPSKSQVLAVVTGLPIGGFLLFLAGLILTGTLIGLALATPVFIIFSPVIVPAALTLAAAVCGFLTSGAFGITALSSMTWLLNQLRGFGGQAKRGVGETIGQVGQKTKEIGQRTQESARSIA